MRDNKENKTPKLHHFLPSKLHIYAPNFLDKPFLAFTANLTHSVDRMIQASPDFSSSKMPNPLIHKKLSGPIHSVESLPDFPVPIFHWLKLIFHEHYGSDEYAD